jgi:hypothetical protein
MNPVRRPHSGSDHDGILAERTLGDGRAIPKTARPFLVI